MARLKSRIKKVRLVLEISPKIREKLDLIISRIEANSMSDVFRRALAIYEVIIEHHLSGGKIILKTKEGSEKELIIY